jgi:metal-responsive CopG/Arc/MetJ family transcriptional regulator
MPEPIRPNPIALTLPERLRERLDAEAALAGSNRSELIRRLVSDGLDRLERRRAKATPEG